MFAKITLIIYNIYAMGRIIKTKQNMTWLFATVFAMILLVAVAVQIPSLEIAALTNEEYDAKIKEIEDRVSEYKSKAAELASQSETLNGAIAQLQLQQDQVQAEIDLNNAKMAQLENEIAANEAKMKKQGAALAKSIAASYIAGQPSALEVLANSNTISDYVENRSQQESLQAQLNSLINQINKLKTELQIQKNKVNAILNDQKSRRDQIDSSKKQQQNLLDQTQGQESKYQDLVKENNQEISRLKAEQIRLNQISGGTVVAGDPNHGGYPAYLNDAPISALIDPWGMFNRQCVSYTAWKVHSTYGNMPYWGGIGNANQWDDNAARIGIPYGKTPKPGSVIVFNSGRWGHVAWVESVNDDGTINVSEYNQNGDGRYHERYNVNYMKEIDTVNFVYFGEWKR